MKSHNYYAHSTSADGMARAALRLQESETTYNIPVVMVSLLT